jgi:hypothetical protein
MQTEDRDLFVPPAACASMNEQLRFIAPLVGEGIVTLRDNKPSCELSMPTRRTVLHSLALTTGAALAANDRPD